MTQVNKPNPARSSHTVRPKRTDTANKTTPASEPKIPNSVKTSTLAAGSAATTVSFVGGSSGHIIKLQGLRQGDKLNVDGIATANGTGQLKELNDKAMDIQAEVNIPKGVQWLAKKDFKLINGKVNLSIRVEKQGADFYYKLIDNYSGKVKGSGKSEIVVQNSSFRRANTMVQKQLITVKTPEGNIAIAIENDPKGKVSGSFTVPSLPDYINEFDFTKQ